MGQPSDWTERHRPRSEQLLEGNEVQRRKIRAWLDEWQNGTPKKKAILLIGPPGVGKTTVARAIAEDMGWNVIELNASDARNAAAIRKAATSGATHRSLFHDPSAPPSRTLILLDEVEKESEQKVLALLDKNHRLQEVYKARIKELSELERKYKISQQLLFSAQERLRNIEVELKFQRQCRQEAFKIQSLLQYCSNSFHQVGGNGRLRWPTQAPGTTAPPYPPSSSIQCPPPPSPVSGPPPSMIPRSVSIAARKMANNNPN